MPKLSDYLSSVNIESYVTATDPAVRNRQRIEMSIAHAFIFAACEKNFVIAVDDGESLSTKFGLSLYGDALKLMSDLDDCILYVYEKKGEKWKRVGWAQFIFGNDGWDVISDYSANPTLDELIEKGTVAGLVKHYGGGD